MLTGRNLLLMVILIFVGLGLSAQFPQYVTYDDERGLPSNEVYSIALDSKGFIWIGCEAGLYKFDGIRYKHYACVTQKSNSVTGLSFSAAGQLYCYNFQSQIFFLRDDTLYELQHTLSRVQNITCDPSGRLYVNHEKGLGIYDPTNKQWTTYNSFGKSSTVSPDLYNKSVHINAAGDAVFLNNYGVGIISGGVLKIDSINFFREKSTGKFLMECRQNENWVFSILGEEVFRNTNGVTQVYSNSKLSDLLAGRKVTNVQALPDGYLWICTYSGVILFNPESDSVRLLYPGISFSDCLYDAEGNYWLATLGSGLLRIAYLEFLVWNDFASQQLTRCVTDGKHVFFSSRSGFIGRINTTTHETRYFECGNGDIESLDYDPVDSCVYFFSKNTLYALKGDAISVAAPALPPVKSLRHIDEGFVMCSSAGTYLMNLRNGITSEKISHTWARESIYDTRRQLMWVATNDGIVKYGRDISGWREEKNFLRGTQVISMCYDELSETLYCIVYDGSVYAIDNLDRENKITALDGVIQFHRLIVFEDHLYTASSKGIHIYSLNDHEWRSITSFDGLISDNVQDIVISNNNLWIVTGKGLERIPLNYSPQTSPMHIYISRVHIGGEMAALNRSLHMDYDQVLTIMPEVTGYRTNGLYQYMYRTGNRDTAWTMLPASIESIVLKNLPTGDNNFELKAVDKNGNASENLISFTISVSPPFWETWWFIALNATIIVLVTGASFRILLKRRQKKLMEQNELNISKLTAIRSQMNPHFIFNSLNSIQDLVLKGDIENSYSYITTFSDLVRKTLSSSDQDFIDLESELKLIRLYLSLEELRFTDTIEFEIDDIQTEGLMIPPLLIQPFIENSLIHGLLHKKGQRRLKIEFALTHSFICTITDNGVGRERAKQIKDRRNIKHESFSGSAIQKRFEILSRVFGSEYGFTYEDLKENGSPVGTRVRLVMPVKRNY